MAISHFARALGRGALRQAGCRHSRHRQARRAARQAARSQGQPIGPRSSTSSGRSPRPGCVHAEGKYDEALKAMSAAADAEDKTEKHAVTPGPLAPARELYGFMLLDRGMAKEALAAFEATTDEGAEPLQRVRRSREGIRKPRRQGKGQRLLPKSAIACGATLTPSVPSSQLRGSSSLPTKVAWMQQAMVTKPRTFAHCRHRCYPCNARWLRGVFRSARAAAAVGASHRPIWTS